MAKRTSTSLFKTFTFTWGQAALFKWGMLALGIIVGAYWHDFFADYFVLLAVIAVACLSYVTYVWWKQ
jgi:hypothetical protein